MLVGTPDADILLEAIKGLWNVRFKKLNYIYMTFDSKSHILKNEISYMYALKSREQQSRDPWVKVKLEPSEKYMSKYMTFNTKYHILSF